MLIQEFIDHIRSGQLAPAWMYLDGSFDLVLTMAQGSEYAHAMKKEDHMRELTEYMMYMSDMYANMDW